jgi:hypothetical protein
MPNLVQFNSLTNVWRSFKINYRKIASRFANSTLPFLADLYLYLRYKLQEFTIFNWASSWSSGNIV